ncbi:reticulon-like protein B9 [Corylus avellana]|uniref:reticulon-like protein B9 n=1 Tax=Corylus avellana TaxID=13451 RepID=UPI00286AB695|nr:reticulon-like protein B9 [Corylus avellana]
MTSYFGRDVHELLGGGEVAEVLLWKKRNVSAALLIGTTIIWFLFEVVEYNFVALFCHISITAMLLFFLWCTGAEIFRWDPPKIPESILQESAFKEVASTFHTRFNQLLSKLMDIAYGKDPPLFLLAIFSLYILSVVGTYVSFLNLLYFGLVCMQTLPYLYDRYKDEVDSLVGDVIRDMKTKYSKFDSKFLNKIPRGPVKEKKVG